MATLRLREESVERRAKASRLLVHRKINYEYDYEIHQYRQYFNQHHQFEPPVPFVPPYVKEEREVIDCYQAAQMYGGVVIIDYRAKKPAAANIPLPSLRD